MSANRIFPLRISLFLLLVTAASAVAQSKKEVKEATERRDKTLFAVEASPKKFHSSVQANYVHNELLIPVTINGKTYSFLFDTGAVTIVTPELAQELQLTELTANRMIDANGNLTEEKIYRLDQLSTGGVTFSNIGCASMSLDAFSTLFCQPIDGIFGSNIMRLANWKVDYQTGKIEFSTDKLLPDSDYETVDFEPNFSGSPVVKLVTGQVRFPAMIDTGNNRSLDMPQDIYQQIPSLKKAITRESFGRASLSLGGNKDQAELAVQADSLYFGELLLRKQHIRVSPAGPVLIGNVMLKQFGQVVISWKKEKMYLPKQFRESETDKSFGISPLLEGDKIVISEIWKGSEAEQFGISVGDEILSVNGLAVSPATSSLWCELIEQTEKTDTLEVSIRNQDGKTSQFVLKQFELFR